MGYNTTNGGWEIGTVTNYSLNKQVGYPTGWTGWTQMSSFNVGTTPYYVQYNSSNGQLQINAIPNCDSIQTVFDPGPVLPAKLTHVVAMNGPDGTPFLLAYDNTQTALQLYVIGTNAMKVPNGLIQVNNAFQLGSNYTNLMPYNFNGSPCFIAYMGSNAKFIQLKQVSADAYSMTDVGDQPWGPGWVALVPALTRQEFLAYSPSEVIAVDGITINNGVQSAQNSEWITGVDTTVSLFAPFYVKQVDTSSTLPSFISYYQDTGQTQVWIF